MGKDFKGHLVKTPTYTVILSAAFIICGHPGTS